MKKIKCILSLMASLCLLGACVPKTVVSSNDAENGASSSAETTAPEDLVKEFSGETEYAIGTERSGLGFAFNAVENAYFDATEIKLGAPVFDYGFIKTQIANATFTPINAYKTRYYSTVDKQADIWSPIKEYVYGEEITAGAEICLNELLERNDSLETYEHVYSYKFDWISEIYSCALPSYKADGQSYLENLDATYASCVIALLEGTPTDEAVDGFFDTYGTHVIMSATYGARMELYYGVGSNVQAEIYACKQSMDTAMQGYWETGVWKGSDPMETFPFGIMNFKALGGAPLSMISIEDFAESFSAWEQTVAEKPSILSATADGLIPLWELLPVGYNTEENSAKLRTLYTEYTDRLQ